VVLKLRLRLCCQGLQRTFMGCMDTNKGGDLTSELGLWSTTMRGAESAGLTIDKPAALATARLHGKRCCGAHAVLAAMQPKELPKNPSELPKYIFELEARLKRKGIGEGAKLVPLPQRFGEVLGKLKTPAAQPARAVAVVASA